MMGRMRRQRVTSTVQGSPAILRAFTGYAEMNILLRNGTYIYVVLSSLSYPRPSLSSLTLASPECGVEDPIGLNAKRVRAVE